MDTIDRINQYRDRCRIPYAPVIVKKLNNGIYTTLYVAVKAKKEECATIRHDRALLPIVIQDLKSFNIIKDEEEIKAILTCGDLSKFKHYSKFVYKYPLRKVDVRNRREEQFRLYTKSAEQQRELMLSINLCPTAELSWKSVLTKIGTEYGLFLKIQIDNSNTNTSQKNI